ncbi:MAG: DUF3368 domain-containing protein [Thermodesulfovibrionia bacterium]|nr:DUF3368 domain-containing protein [Thermodesulfovibrionia bacterium]
MRVVNDSDVIIHLSKLEKLSLFHSLYKEVAIPEHIKLEILIKKNIELQKAFNSFLKVFATSKDKAGDIAKKHNIHVKVLGEELKATLFLSNERRVRKAATEEGFIVSGTIGIILKAVKNGLIAKSEAVSLMEKMKAQDFRIHPDILQKVMNTIKEI